MKTDILMMHFENQEDFWYGKSVSTFKHDITVRFTPAWYDGNGFGENKSCRAGKGDGGV